MSAFQKKILIILILLAVLAPVGIWLPKQFNAGDAWGEWPAEVLENMIGFIPEGLKKYSDLWKPPIPDYNLGGEKSSFTLQALSYILSGIVGIAVSIGVAYALWRFVIRRKE
ncbi:MAG: hypothetical protein A2W19_02650 [Spirochaetes bacterium RBG_16_49_21]|nr:MAG: hypothetical protein A2W19_02650 [Spirochaetes bacterium RBG_16_49_21]